MLTFETIRWRVLLWWQRLRFRDVVEYLAIAGLLLAWAAAKGWGH